MCSVKFISMEAKRRAAAEKILPVGEIEIKEVRNQWEQYNSQDRVGMSPAERGRWTVEARGSHG